MAKTFEAIPAVEADEAGLVLYSKGRWGNETVLVIVQFRKIRLLESHVSVKHSLISLRRGPSF